MTVLRVCYKPGRFDEAYYKATHLPLVGRVTSPHGMKRMEMVKLTLTPDGSKPLYQVNFSAYFESATGLQNALKDPKLGPVLDDIKNFHDGSPDIFIGDVVDL
jgi:uncharacterized protein (TIGR02118 family)